jgi:rod shape-determining protein MreC
LFPQRATRSVIRSIAAARLVRGVTPAAFVVFAASLILLHRMGAGPVENLRSVISDVAAPVLSSLSAPFVTAAESVDTIADLRQMRADNIQLKKDNEKLRQWYETALRMQAENLALKELLNVKADPVLNFVTARVISDPGGTFVQSYLLPVGAEDHVRKGSAVMSGQR